MKASERNKKRKSDSMSPSSTGGTNPGATIAKFVPSHVAPTSAADGATSRVPSWGVVGLVAVAVATPLVPSEAVTSGGGVLLILAVLGLLVAAAMFALRSGQRTIVFEWPDLLLMLLIAWHTLSGLLALRDGHARPTINILWQWLAFGLIWFLARQWLRQPAAIRAVCATLLSVAVGLSCLGFYQCLYTMPRDREAFRVDPEASLRDAGIVAPPGSALREQYRNRLESREPLATFALTNSLAGLLTPWFLFAVGLLVVSRGGAPLTTKSVVGVAIAAIAVGACLLLTKSRSAYVATLAGIGLLGAWSVRARWQWGWRLPLAFVGITISLIIVAVEFGMLDIQVLSEAKKSLGYRWEYWTSTVAMIGDQPLWGCGPGGFQDRYAAYKLPQASEMVADPHNFLLELAATAGCPALLLCGIAMLEWLRRLRRASMAGTASSGTAGAAGAADQADPADTLVWPVYQGAIAGVVLGFVASFVAGFVPDLAILFTAVPLAILVLALLDPWVRGGRCPIMLLVLPLVGLFVNLLAAGSLSFPGVIQTWWLVGACALNLGQLVSQGASSTVHDASQQNDSPRQAPSRAPQAVWAALAVSGLFLILGFYFSMYRPILNCRLQIDTGDQAWAQGRPATARESFAAAAEADPWSVDPWLRLAAVARQRWAESRQASEWDALLDAATQATRRASRSQAVATELSQLFHSAYRDEQRDEALQLAIVLAQKSNALYPNNNTGHARLAGLWYEAGELDRARDEAREALRLNELNPHREQKLDGRPMRHYVELVRPWPANRGTPPQSAKQWLEWLVQSNEQ